LTSSAVITGYCAETTEAVRNITDKDSKIRVLNIKNYPSILKQVFNFIALRLLCQDKTWDWHEDDRLIRR
jgi:hypothetical protein